jgi:hypothetical protein
MVHSCCANSVLWFGGSGLGVWGLGLFCFFAFFALEFGFWGVDRLFGGFEVPEAGLRVAGFRLSCFSIQAFRVCRVRGIAGSGGRTYGENDFLRNPKPQIPHPSFLTPKPPTLTPLPAARTRSTPQPSPLYLRRELVLALQGSRKPREQKFVPRGGRRGAKRTPLEPRTHPKRHRLLMLE